MAKRLDADVAVVGLGAMGAASLCRLARGGVRTLGIDRFAPPHDRGSSHGQTRITRQAVGEGPEYAPLVAASHRIWRELEAERADGIPLFVEAGVLMIGPAGGEALTHGTDDFLGRTLAVAQARGIAHERLDAHELGDRFPMFLGLTDRTQGYLEPGGGYVFPERCIAAQTGLAERAGARVLSNTTVLDVREGDRCVAIETDVGTFRADRAVVAAGPWCGPLLGAPFERLLTVTRQALHWFELEPGAAASYAGQPAFIRLHGGRAEKVFYGFPPVEGDRGIKVATEQWGQATSIDALARRVDPDEPVAMHATHVAPRLDGVRRTSARPSVACAYTTAPGHRFVIDDHPATSRVLVVSACSGHGFKHSAGIGEAVAERLITGASTVDLAPFSLDRVRAESVSPT